MSDFNGALSGWKRLLFKSSLLILLVFLLSCSFFGMKRIPGWTKKEFREEIARQREERALERDAEICVLRQQLKTLNKRLKKLEVKDKNE